MSLCGHVDMLACWHNSRYYCLMGIGTLAHRCTDMPSCRHAVQCTHFYTLQEIKYYHGHTVPRSNVM